MRTLAFLLAVALVTSAQEPPRRYKLGKVFPPPVREQLRLTAEQVKQLEEIEKDLAAKLAKILTEEQRKVIDGQRPAAEVVSDAPPGPRLTLGGTLVAVADPKTKLAFTLTGDAAEGVLGDARTEHSGRGIRLLSGKEHAGAATWSVGGLKPADRWYRVRVHGLALDNFRVEKDNLYLRVEFFKDAGTNPLDHVTKSLYDLVERDRKDLTDPGTNKSLGNAVWRTFTLDLRTPFAEVDTVRVAVGFGNGVAADRLNEFWVREVEVTPIPDPVGYLPSKKAPTGPPALASVVKIGGRWYFDPRGGSKTIPKQFDHTNADRLLYLTDRLEAPFADNTTAWLRKGYYDRANTLVEKEKFVPDNVVITFTDTHLVMKSKNLPNHPTAVFPDRSRFLDGNPNVIREQAHTWRIPLEPKANPKAVAMTLEDHRGLPMGPVGVAVNGVVFFNPFDADAVPALWRLDRCCGHPSPGSEYHYHKYPVCVNTPWDDDGSAHSPLIGFAFDGFPVFGPYESAGVMAKDAKSNPLNAFNLHTDDARGPHYHVTPGKFPYILGGYWGEVEARRRGPR